MKRIRTTENCYVMDVICRMGIEAAHKGQRGNEDILYKEISKEDLRIIQTVNVIEKLVKTK